MTYRSVMVLFTIIAINGCIGDIHSWGELNSYNHHMMYSRTLIDESSVIPRDYTIFYKHYGAPFKPVARFEIDVNMRSEGCVYMRHITSRHKWTETAQSFDARVSIRNATDVTATVHIYGGGIMSMSSMDLRKLDSTKSVTYVHAKNSDLSIRQQMPMPVRNSIGKRRYGDELIYFKSKRVRNTNRFASAAFEYSGDEYITCVRFSFDSATAMIMINTTLVGEKVFNGIVYDMNSDYFVANMSIYGTIRPYGFEGVI